MAIEIDKVSLSHKPVCGICGQSHEAKKCLAVENMHYISDAPIMSRARQTLPKDFKIVDMADGSTNVITLVELHKGTTLGPLCGRKASVMNASTDFPIKVFGDKSSETMYLDSSNENYSNWMRFIATATSEQEQNLICYQVMQNIYYTAMCTIPVGETLKVWYAPYYALKMNMPLYNKSFAVYNTVTLFNKQLEIEEMNQPVKHQSLSNDSMVEKLMNKGTAQESDAPNNIQAWNCKFCSVTSTSVATYAKHLMGHYKPLQGIHCDICDKKCNNTSVLKRHKKAKHREVDEKNVESISMNNEDAVALEESLFSKLRDCEPVTVVHEQNLLDELNSGIITKDIIEQCMCEKNHTCGLSNLKSNLENNKDPSQTETYLSSNIQFKVFNELIATQNTVASTNSDIDELASHFLQLTDRKLTNFECDICKKKFGKVDYLCRHLRKHTGEFTCPHCHIVFARKENLLSHACISANLEYSYECSLCQKAFTQKKYLKRHMAKHNEQVQCKWCHTTFASLIEQTVHKCTAPQYVCDKCKKRFVHKMHLNRHMISQCNSKPTRKKIKKKKDANQSAVCEKCGDIFGNPQSLKQHLFTHGERMFECNICHSRFYRMAILKEHMSVHENANISCNVCGKKVKSKKVLDVHMLLHGNKKYDCNKCGKSFYQKCNYLKHYKHMHENVAGYKCSRCTAVLTDKQSLDEHMKSHIVSAQCVCSFCMKTFQKEHQLKRHVQVNHSNVIYRCPFCHKTTRHKQSFKRHFKRQHNTLRLRWDKPGFVDQHAEYLQLAQEEATKESDNFLVDNYVHVAKNNAGTTESKQGETIDFCTVLNEEKRRLENWKESAEPYVELGNIPETDQIIAFVESSSQKEIQQIKLNDVLNDVPQISMPETLPTTESVLKSTYVDDDDGGDDIMFYVLQ